jgi:hypothetical protein
MILKKEVAMIKLYAVLIMSMVSVTAFSDSDSSSSTVPLLASLQQHQLVYNIDDVVEVKNEAELKLILSAFNKADGRTQQMFQLGADSTSAPGIVIATLKNDGLIALSFESGARGLIVPNDELLETVDVDFWDTQVVTPEKPITAGDWLFGKINYLTVLHKSNPGLVNL